jgi:hypothetical protein
MHMGSQLVSHRIHAYSALMVVKVVPAGDARSTMADKMSRMEYSFELGRLIAL